jgi:hypothetical protein
MAEDDDNDAVQAYLEDRVEKEFDRLKLFLALAWRENPRFVQALADRIAVEHLTGDAARARRRVYRAMVDYIEDALEEREGASREAERRSEGRKSYLRRLLEGDE